MPDNLPAGGSQFTRVYQYGRNTEAALRARVAALKAPALRRILPGASARWSTARIADGDHQAQTVITPPGAPPVIPACPPR